MAQSSFPLTENELRQWIAQSVAEVFRDKADELFAQKIAAFVSENERRARELALMERVVRVEEELKALREIEIAQFGAAEKRFDAIDKRFEAMERRFEAVDQRFEELQREMASRFETVDKRFEAMDKRFTALQWTMGLGFSLMVAFMSLPKMWS
uniref:DUF1640 domain-containing protein n=1 Tax=Desulfacinum infernum TaxID=35837 RepID=A0A832EJH2_9BACT